MREWVKDSIDVVASGVMPLDTAVRKIEKVEYEVANCRVEIDGSCLNAKGEVQGRYVFHNWEGNIEEKSEALEFDENFTLENAAGVLEVFAQPFIKDSFVRVNGMRNLFQHVLVGITLSVLEEAPAEAVPEEAAAVEAALAEGAPEETGEVHET